MAHRRAYATLSSFGLHLGTLAVLMQHLLQSGLLCFQKCKIQVFYPIFGQRGLVRGQSGSCKVP